jgi:hypothetical protein
MEILEKPTWDECIQLMRDDKQRSFRVDIETDATISGDYMADQKAITELLKGISAFIHDAGPAVQAGYLPIEAAKSMILAAVRRFKLGREVEDALDMIGETDPEQVQESSGGVQEALQMKLQIEQQETHIKAQEVQQKTQIEEARMQMETSGKQADLAIQEKEIALREREIAIKEFEVQVAREKMAFSAREADKQRQVELAKAIMAEFTAPGVSITDPEQALNRAAEIMARINAVLSATNLPLAETTMLVAEEPIVGVEDPRNMLQ